MLVYGLQTGSAENCVKVPWQMTSMSDHHQIKHSLHASFDFVEKPLLPRSRRAKEGFLNRAVPAHFYQSCRHNRPAAQDKLASER